MTAPECFSEEEAEEEEDDDDDAAAIRSNRLLPRVQAPLLYKRVWCTMHSWLKSPATPHLQTLHGTVMFIRYLGSSGDELGARRAQPPHSRLVGLSRHALLTPVWIYIMCFQYRVLVASVGKNLTLSLCMNLHLD